MSGIVILYGAEAMDLMLSILQRSATVTLTVLITFVRLFGLYTALSSLLLIPLVVLSNLVVSDVAHVDAANVVVSLLVGALLCLPYGRLDRMWFWQAFGGLCLCSILLLMIMVRSSAFSVTFPPPGDMGTRGPFMDAAQFPQEIVTAIGSNVVVILVAHLVRPVVSFDPRRLGGGLF